MLYRLYVLAKLLLQYFHLMTALTLKISFGAEECNG